MLKEAIELIATMAKKNDQPTPIVGGRNKQRVFVRGLLQEIADDFPARNHTANDLESFAACIHAPDLASVWHHGNQVVAILSDDDHSYRDDRVTWPIKGSSKFAALTKDAPQPRPHADFVRFIVQNLRDEFDAAAPGLLGTIRNLKFRNVDAAEGSVQQGRESMGREIQNEITGATDLPETVIIRVKRWADLDCIAEVECLLVLDVENRKLSLRPLADQLEQAENAAQKWLHDVLASATEAPIFYGTP